MRTAIAAALLTCLCGASPAAAQEGLVVCDGLKPDGDQVEIGRAGFRKLRMTAVLEPEPGAVPRWAIILATRDRTRDLVFEFIPVGPSPNEPHRVYGFEIYEARPGDGPIEKVAQGGKGVAFGYRFDIELTNPADGKVRMRVASGFDRTPQTFDAALDIAPMPQEFVVISCSGARFEFTGLTIE